MRFLGRNTHYLKYKKMKNYDNDYKLILHELTELMKTMEKNIREFEFL